MMQLRWGRWWRESTQRQWKMPLQWRCRERRWRGRWRRRRRSEQGRRRKRASPIEWRPEQRRSRALRHSSRRASWKGAHSRNRRPVMRWWQARGRRRSVREAATRVQRKRASPIGRRPEQRRSRALHHSSRRGSWRGADSLHQKLIVRRWLTRCGRPHTRSGASSARAHWGASPTDDRGAGRGGEILYHSSRRQPAKHGSCLARGSRRSRRRRRATFRDPARSGTSTRARPPGLGALHHSSRRPVRKGGGVRAAQRCMQIAPRAQILRHVSALDDCPSRRTSAFKTHRPPAARCPPWQACLHEIKRGFFFGFRVDCSPLRRWLLPVCF